MHHQVLQQAQQRRACVGGAALRATRRTATPRVRAQPSGQASAPSAPPPPSRAELLSATEKLVQLAKQHAGQEELDAQAELITQLSAAAGTDKVAGTQHNGTFRGFTLTGRTAERFKTVITLGVLSFNQYQPVAQKIRMMDSDSGSVLKGEYGGNPQAYVVTAPFELVEAGKVGEESGEATPLGIRGLHVVVGEYKQDPDNPQRLAIFFKKTRMEPVVDSPADLQRWLDTLLEHNPKMDPKTGVLEVDLPANSPEGWLDHVLVLPEYQLLKGNYGSRTLLQRVQ